MLRRLANVLWWAGLLVGCSLTAPYLYSLYLHMDCAAVVALQGDIDRANEAAMEKYQKEHPTSDAVDALLARQAQPARAVSRAGAIDLGQVQRAVKSAPATASSGSALDAVIARDGGAPAGTPPWQEYASQAAGRYVLIDERSTPEHEERLRNCKQAVDALGLFAGWAFALIAWTLAYIIAGSFWRPASDPR